MKRPLFPCFALAAALLVSACDSKPTMRETLPADAAAELNELIEVVLPELNPTFLGIPLPLVEWDEDDGLTFGRSPFDEVLGDLAGQFEELLDEYDETGKVDLKTEPDAITPLHIAVQYRKEALVRELLKQGADPNAPMCPRPEMRESNPEIPAEWDAPLCWTVVSQWGYNKPTPPECAIRLIDMLVEAGADVKGDAGGHTLFMSTITMEDDRVYQHLLDLGADPRRGYLPQHKGDAALVHVLGRGWRDVARRLQQEGLLNINAPIVTDTKTLYDDEGNEIGERDIRETPLFSAIKRSYITDEGLGERQRAEISLMLELGADVNAPHEDGLTPLLVALEKLPRADDGQGLVEACGWLLLELLRHGGSFDARYPESWRSELTGKTVAELIRSNGRLAAYMEAQGFELPPAPAETN